MFKLATRSGLSSVRPLCSGQVCRPKVFDNWPNRVKIVEVGPRDGLQNEPNFLPTSLKVELIHRLSQCGLTCIEATSFVSPRWIPQLSDCDDVMRELRRKDGLQYPVLVPNANGLRRALKHNVKDVAVFVAASETFSRKNTNCSIEESLIRLNDVFSICKESKVNVRGYVSCAIACPYEGATEVETVCRIVLRLLDAGCFEVSLGDTIGVGTPGTVGQLLTNLLTVVKPNQLAVHFHDTYGQALANVLLALSMGISVVDSSLAGLGGCPYAPGASGNLATESLLYLLDGLGVKTGVDLKQLTQVSLWICDALKRSPGVAAAMARRFNAQF